VTTVARAIAQSGLVPVDAQVLLAHALGVSRTWLSGHADDELPPAKVDDFLRLAQRRRTGEPVAYLTGTREFFGLTLAVTPAVLIPRPETETLVEVALARIAVAATARILDLGTGSGAIALALAHARPQARVVAADASGDALAVARANAQGLGLGNVEFVVSDWFAALAGQSFDLVVANPPYIAAADPHLGRGDLRFEPRCALTPGDDGLAALRRITGAAPVHLAAGATLAVEHGYDQGDAVASLFVAAGYGDVVSVRDLAGIVRVTAGVWPG
jgi:release factor glutamine methyltransferase